MRKTAINRIRVLTILVLFVAVILVGRLYQIQIAHGDQYVEAGERQYVHTTQELYARGNIYFTTKDGLQYSAASIRSGYLLAVDPTKIENAEAVYDEIGELIDIDREIFIERATLPDRTYVEIDTDILEESKQAIDAKELPGVLMYRNQWRYYPGSEVAARTIGFIGYTEGANGGLRGRYGLERQYDDVLVREKQELSVNFFAEIFSNLGQLIFDTSDSRQGDVVTTIEPTVARMLDEVLEQTHTEYNSRLTGGIVMHPQTGAIYALNAVPTYDLNDRSGIGIEGFKNPLVEDVYEMGSIIKALTVASGLDSGAITAQSTYYDAGELELDTFTIRNFDGRGRGTVDMQEVLNQSLNTGVAEIVTRMGKDSFRSYFKNMKLGSETGIDLPNEAYGLIDNLNSPRDVEYATASFGQGIALTPIGTVRALSALGNGGTLVTPHIVSSIEYEDGTVKEIKYPEGARVFSEATSEEVSRMLTAVVDDALRGGTVSMDNYSIAAKTGTAQIADNEGGGYYEDKFLHSFFGYFPAYDPQFIVFLYTVEPHGVRYASETLTDPFMTLSKFLINYYNLPPDR